LTFYLRIFKDSQRLRYITIFYIAFIAMMTISIDLAILFQCIPVDSIWKTEAQFGHPPHCVNGNVLGLAPAAINPITDLAILLLPLPTFIRLQVSPRQKFKVILTFSFGSIAVVASFVRFAKYVSYTHSNDKSWDGIGISIWSTIEICTAIMTACAPALKIIFTRAPNPCGDDHTSTRYINSGQPRNPLEVSTTFKGMP